MCSPRYSPPWYLASGMIRGIGPVYAKKLLNAFSEKVFDVIEAEPDRLREMDGIGPVRAGRIITSERLVGVSTLILPGKCGGVERRQLRA